MAFLQYPRTPSFIRPSFLSPKSPSLLINSIIFTKTPPKPHTKYISFPARPPPNALPTTDQEILDSITGSNGGSAIGEAEVKNLPSVRSYESDLARLTVIGDVRFEQALTAAAADGGDAAEEHIASGMSTMVVETVFPGNSDERSTVSTRLFLPAKRVKEKARELRSTLTADILSSTTSRNILAMTFRQVVLQHLWSFELAVFSPGTERNMEDLANPREVPACFTLSSSDGSVLSALAEAVCLCSLESTETDFLESTQGMASYKMFPWFRKRKRTTSSDSSVHIYKIPQDQIVENAENLVENFNFVKGIYRLREKKPKDRWWASPTYSRLEKIGGPEFSTWTNEYIPSYRLQIDADKFENVKFEGWQKSPDNRWEVLLTHFQMVGLAKILDLYYEDLYTLPNKQLSSGLVSEISKLSKSKRSSSSLRMLSITFAGGCFLVAIGILAQLCKPHLFKARKSPADHYVISSSEIDGCQYQSVEAPELEALCISIVKKIQDDLGWHGDVMTDRDVGAWTGELPSYLTRDSNVDLVHGVVSTSGDAATTSSASDVPTHADLSDSVASSYNSGSDLQMATAQDIASYQVVLSRDGEVIGFQPTSRIAVNHWASNPLAKALYKGRKLSPGFLEPGITIHQPNDAIQLELLMSINPQFQFALVRPVL
ncbi:uncharacterized protein LOC131241108 isoform X2 [Magnolia sinica]|uniref:uncharacterized protein LOC131241108 isoform X2 n=1 Tax=Magnolia sinica TaxID=86752 RepID=UPI00265AF151|nr:uncharacterized protein LOC131241108 isoform X2 [Magnolia sinica]